MNKAKSLFAFLIARMKEPSSWASISVALMAVHINVDPGLWQLVTGAGVGLAALLGYFIPEGASK